MNINSQNYEIFILDYYEGNLNASAIAQLMNYLEQNPEAREAFESYDSLALEPDTSLKFNKKDLLKKTAIVAVGDINEVNYEDYCIECIENNLTTDTDKNLADFFEKNPHLSHILETYKKTLLKPDMDVVFPSKEMLKKTPVIPLVRYSMKRLLLATSSVAAVVAIVIISTIIIHIMMSPTQKSLLSFSGIEIQKNFRKTTPLKPQNPEYINAMASITAFNHTAFKNNTFSNPNSFDHNTALLKPEKIAVFLTENTEVNEVALANMEKRSEYSEILYSIEPLAKKRNNRNAEQDDAGLTNYLVRGIKNAARTATKNESDIKENNKLGLWDIAGFGVYAYNRITDSNLALDKETDATGRLISLNLDDNSSNPPEKK